MTQFRYFLYLILAILGMTSITSCIEDGVSTSPSDQPTFSVDTLRMGTVFTDQVTTTYRMTVYNRHSKVMNISDIYLSGDNSELFRINVDGSSGTRFNNIEIRPNDSIFVMVEATLPETGQNLPIDVNTDLNFVTNGVTQTVVLNATGQDVVRMYHQIITTDTHLTADKPYQIFDSLVVAPGTTLTLDPGTTLHFHDKSSMIVRGTLKSMGTVDNPVNICGDRTGNVITDITFDLMSRQWEGIYFTPSSTDNYITHTCVRNTWYGVIVNGGEAPAEGEIPSAPKLTLHNSRLRNSGDLVLEVYNASVLATGCEFGEAANGLVYLQGGHHTFNHCTFANYYLFSAIGGPALQFANHDILGPGRTTALFSNSIIYGLGASLSHGDLSGTDISLINCLIKESGSDDDNFINCLWDKDPLYYTVRNDYIFDYRLKPESPAISAGDPSLTLTQATVDAYGLNRGSTPDLGAYVFTPPTE